MKGIISAAEYRFAAPRTAFCLVVLLLAGAAAAGPKMWRDDLPVSDPWLREQMPEAVLAYARVPNPYGILAMPKGSSLDAALRSRANIGNMELIRKGLTDNVLPHIPSLANIQFRLLEQQIVSPVELAVIAGDDSPSLLVGLTLGIKTHAEIEEMLELMGVGLLRPLDENGHGQLGVVPIPVFLQFDARSGRLLMQAGPTVTEPVFNAVLDSMAGSAPHRMRAMEERIDAAGQGLFAWVDARTALPLLQANLPPEQAAIATASGLDKIEAVGLGWGVAGGKGRLSVVADLPGDNGPRLLPYVSNDVTAMSAGRPGGMVLLSIPSPEGFSRLEALALSAAAGEAGDGESSGNSWEETKAAFVELVGFEVEEIFEALGPELLLISDDAGLYSAVRVRDRAEWRSIVSRVSDKVGAEPEQRRIDSKTYYHVAVPNELTTLGEAEIDEIGWLAVLMRRQKDHIYWTEEGDYLYLSSIPQTLIERSALRPRTHVGKWLSDEQKIDVSSAILSLNGTSRNTPRQLYAAYIEIMQFLADIGDAEIDIWSMPTPSELELPEMGTLGLTVSLGDPTLVAEMTFENNPVEMLGGVGGVAALGVVAAIAIPAYQDYTVRAAISSGLADAEATKRLVAEFYMENGRFPDRGEVDELANSPDGDPIPPDIRIEADSGNVVISYSEEVAGGGELILYSHVDAEGEVRWTCSGTFADKHLPANCRTDSTPPPEDGGT